MANPASSLPPTPIQRLTRPLVKFLHIQSMGGIVLVFSTAVALIAANSAWAEPYRSFWGQSFRVGIENAELNYPLWYWINDALMAVFFFVIGLEIKRELVIGELRDRRRVVLPIAAAIGGVVVPATIYLAMQSGQAGAKGWAVPMATDIAFVVGCLALLGDRVPHGLKIWMLSLAIVDDILAIVVIALFYTESVKGVWAAGVLICLAFTIGANRVGVRRVSVYVVFGAAMWLCCLKSGIHPTIAGVVLGLITPATAWIDQKTFREQLTQTLDVIEASSEDIPTRRAALGDLAFISTEAVSPLVRLETMLHPWVAFVIMPVFALANAGVEITPSRIADPVAVAVAAGLFIGKPVGIFAASWVVVRLGLATLPHGVRWPVLASASVLGGIGFTMALFIASLGLEGSTLLSAKTGVLAGSALSMVVGTLGLALLLRGKAAQ